MEYIKTKWERIYAGSDGELYTTYYGGYEKKKAKIRKGLKVITIKVNGNKKYVSVAKEIALAFMPNPNNFRYVKEKDGNQMNTHPDNLYWSLSNRMDYKAFGEKKKGMKYVSYIGKVYGDFKVIESKNNLCTISCTSCGSRKKVKRTIVSKYTTCVDCKDTSLNISELKSPNFRNWIILKEEGTENIGDKYEKKIRIKCNCCGQEDVVEYRNFVRRTTEYKCDINKEKHEYLRRKYHAMKRRCYYKNDKTYKNYGGRGIKICNEWLKGSKHFIEWGMNNGFEIGLEIDRIDNEKNYSPNNCRFISRKENTRNQRRTVLNKKIVRKIRNTNWGNLNYSEIAVKLGLSKDLYYLIGSVIRNETWKDVK